MSDDCNCAAPHCPSCGVYRPVYPAGPKDSAGVDAFSLDAYQDHVRQLLSGCTVTWP